MSNQEGQQGRVVELEREVHELRVRVAVLEAERKHMATKVDVIEASGNANLSSLGRKPKSPVPSKWINSDVNFVLAMVVAVILAFVLGPLVIRALGELFSLVF